MDKSILALCGGVGGAKLVQGLGKTLRPGNLFVLVNTGDDFHHLGLPVSPDLDTVMYTLAGVADQAKGWGIAGETWHFMEMISRFDDLSWFNLGDKDLATHLYRARAAREGLRLDEITRSLSRSFGIEHDIIPMSNDPVRTLVVTDRGTLAFQDYFVRLNCSPRVKAIKFAGCDKARVPGSFTDLLNENKPDAIIIAPSNPLLSIAPILSLEGVRSALQSASAPVVAVSPIISGKALKGPTAKIMEQMDMPVNNVSIAEFYRDFLDGLVIDNKDEHETGEIEKLGIRVKTTGTLMNSIRDRIALAETTIRFADSLSA